MVFLLQVMSKLLIVSLHCVKNTVISPNFLVWKLCRKAQANRPKLCGNYDFPQNFHTRKLRYFSPCSLCTSNLLIQENMGPNFYQNNFAILQEAVITFWKHCKIEAFKIGWTIYGLSLCWDWGIKGLFSLT